MLVLLLVSPTSDTFCLQASTSPSQPLFLRHCDMMVYATEIPTHFWWKDPAMDAKDATFVVRKCPGSDMFELNPMEAPAAALTVLKNPSAGFGSDLRLVVSKVASSCATGVGVFKIIAAGNDNNSVAIESAEFPGHRITLANDRCGCPAGVKSCCNFTGHGDTCQSPFLRKTAAAGQPQQKSQHFQLLDPKSPRVPGLAPSPAPYLAPVALDAHAVRSADGTSLSVRVVNPLGRPVAAAVYFASRSGFAATMVTATILTSESLHDDNSPDQPLRVAPRPFAAALRPGGGGMEEVVFPANSFVVFQLSS